MYRPFNAAISGCYFAGVEKRPDETNMSLYNSYNKSLGDASRIAQRLDYGLDGARIAAHRGRSNGHQAILAARSGVRTGIEELLNHARLAEGGGHSQCGSPVQVLGVNRHSVVKKVLDSPHVTVLDGVDQITLPRCPT